MRHTILVGKLQFYRKQTQKQGITTVFRCNRKPLEGNQLAKQRKQQQKLALKTTFLSI